jgi:hypothetical protein
LFLPFVLSPNKVLPFPILNMSGHLGIVPASCSFEQEVCR